MHTCTQHKHMYNVPTVNYICDISISVSSIQGIVLDFTSDEEALQLDDEYEAESSAGYLSRKGET